MQCVSHEMRLLSYSAELGCFIFKTGGSNKQTSFPPKPLTPPNPIKWLENRNADVERKDSYRWVIVFMSSGAQICLNATFTHIINLYCLPALYIELYSKAVGGMEKKGALPKNQIPRSFHSLLATCCRPFPYWNVRHKQLSQKIWVVSAAHWIIIPSLISHPWALCAHLRLGDDSDSCAPVWEDSLIFRTPYWLGLAQRFWLAASLRPVLTRGFWFG